MSMQSGMIADKSVIKDVKLGKTKLRKREVSFSLSEDPDERKHPPLLDKRSNSLSAVLDMSNDKACQTLFNGCISFPNSKSISSAADAKYQKVAKLFVQELIIRAKEEAWKRENSEKQVMSVLS